VLDGKEVESWGIVKARYLDSLDKKPSYVVEDKVVNAIWFARYNDLRLAGLAGRRRGRQS
jgi:hypothetical protein